MAVAKVKTYPDDTLVKAARATGAVARYLWQVKNPGGSRVAWLECWQIGGSIAMIQTFDGGGWDVFTPCASRDVAETIADALNRCGVKAGD